MAETAQTDCNADVAPRTGFSLDKPLSEEREYKHLTLSNKLEVFLISDPKCDRAAVALDVDIGSLYDPSNLQGLAHFLEHMLFLGTEKYPDEDSYNRYLQQNGGDSNAFTSDTNTCYHFTVAPGALDGALDRFAQFFLSPLFTESATTRELDAVNSEHRKNALNDARRHYQLVRHLANPAHPLSHFGTGNHKTLRDDPIKCGINIRNALLQFHQRYYSANIMRLCVLGRDSLETLERMVANSGRFENIRNTDVVVPKGAAVGPPGEPPFRCCDLGTLVRFVPIQDTNCITFQWVLPEQTELWKSKPLRYITHLLGHEGKGSLLSVLKKEQLGTELVCYPYIDYAGVCILCCSIFLTDTGIAQDGIKRVGRLLFKYLELLKSVPVQSWVNDELSHLSNIGFKFMSQMPPESHVVSVARAMHEYPPEHVLSGPHLIWEHQDEETQKLLALLKPSQMAVYIQSLSFTSESQNWDKEPYYGTVYQQRPLDENLLADWGGQSSCPSTTSQPAVRGLHFPTRNPFIPSDLECKPHPGNEPECHPKKLTIPRRPDVTLKTNVYFKQDFTFKLPKVVVVTRLCSPYTQRGLRELEITELYLLTVNQLLNEYAYDAEVAGLMYRLACTADNSMNTELYNIEIQLSGYNDTLPQLLDEVCKRFRTATPFTEETFAIAKTILVRNLKALAKNKQPYQQAMDNARRYLQQPYYTAEQRLAAVESITYDDVHALCESDALIKDLVAEVLIQGNFTEDEAIHCVSVIEDRLSIATPERDATKVADADDVPVTWAVSKTANLNRSSNENPYRLRVVTSVAHSEEKNNGVVFIVQVGNLEPEEAGVLNMAATYLNQPFFDCLRTKQQLGYIVGARSNRSLQCSELVFIVQSDCVVTGEVTSRVEAFLEHFVKNAPQRLTENEFEQLRQSTISQLEEKPKFLTEEVTRNYVEIALRRYDFSRREKQCSFLRTLTQDQFLKFLREKIYAAPWLVSEAIPKQEIQQPPTCNTLQEVNNATPTVVNDRECALTPTQPTEWTTVTDSPDTFFKTFSSSPYLFPTPV